MSLLKKAYPCKHGVNGRRGRADSITEIQHGEQMEEC